MSTGHGEDFSSSRTLEWLKAPTSTNVVVVASPPCRWWALGTPDYHLECAKHDYKDPNTAIAQRNNFSQAIPKG